MAANLINQLSTANTFQHWLQTTQSLVGTTNLLTNGNGDTFFANTVLRVGGTAANVSLNVETGATINVTTGNTVNTINLESREFVSTGNITSKTTISMNTGTGTFQTGEIVFQGPDATVANATAKAIVYTWNFSNKLLSIIQANGVFTQDANTYGESSGAIWSTINTSSGFTFTAPNVALPTNVHVERDLYVDGNTSITGNTNIYGTTTIAGDLNVSGNITLDVIGFDDLNVSGSGSFGNNLTVLGNTSLTNVTATNLTVTGETTLSTANIQFITGNAVTQFDAAGDAVALSVALG